MGAAVLGLAGLALARSGRERHPARAQETSAAPASPVPPAPERVGSTRLLALLALAALFFAGAAFSAGPDGPVVESVPKVAPKAVPHAKPRVHRRAPGHRLELRAIAKRRFFVPRAHRRRARRLASRHVLAAARPSEQAIAIDRYFHALGSDALLVGLQSSSSALVRRVLQDPRVKIYPAGRADIAAGRIDPRVLALVEYLAEAHGEITVVSLISGHGLYARPETKIVSAHVYGRAVDISALGGVPIAGHQQPGGITEEAIREILALPAEVHPRQVISLLDLGGPSFPLPDHGDHIHVGY